jgi:hypothetical protein
MISASKSFTERRPSHPSNSEPSRASVNRAARGRLVLTPTHP